MKWSPPRIEHCQSLAHRLTLMTLACTGFSSGCTAMPVMQSASAVITHSATATSESAAEEPYTAAEKARLAAMSAVPQFDDPARTPKLATMDSSGVVVAAPKPFAWERTGKSSGDRPFLTATLGDDGYRTLVVGSVGGHDPMALELVDRLTRRLHEDSLILGGFESTVIRTLNPDGESSRTLLNQKGQYVNHGFPKTGDAPNGEQPVEVSFLLSRLKELQPQRVLHLRTIDGNVGLIAASSSCQAAAKEAAEWLNFRLVSLPDKAVAGSLERYLAASGTADIITIAIPTTTKDSELWDRYGDTLLNLLLSEDLASREIARRQAQQSSADRRNTSPGK